MGPGAIHYAEIDAYSRLVEPLAAWEVAAIRKIDGAWLNREAASRPVAAPEKPGMVRVDDPDGVARLFKELS